jgi:hypothetical protein
VRAFEPDDSPTPLSAICGGAEAFGLSGEEVWSTMDDVLASVGGEATLDDYLDELCGALAFRIVDKHRRGPAPDPRAAARRRRTPFGR